VVQFVGFMGAFRNPGALDPYVAGTLGALVTTWVTFVPCFLWIFLGAPYIEWLRGNQRLSAALSAITAAVVGVVLNLGIWFALHVLFAEVDERAGPLGSTLLVPDLSTLDPFALVIGVGAAVAMLRFHVKMLPVLGVAALAGLGVKLLFA
jgi:chromate transporter